MNKLLTGAVALTLSVPLAACTKDAPTATPTTATSTSTATPTPTEVKVDQSTPELAMTSWLGAMVAGKGETVCNLMAADGKAISSIPAATAACGKTITPMLESLKEVSATFSGLTITGATVKGETATFESVTTKPAVAAEVVANFKAVKIGEKWYITQ